MKRTARRSMALSVLHHALSARAVSAGGAVIGFSLASVARIVLNNNERGRGAAWSELAQSLSVSGKFGGGLCGTRRIIQLIKQRLSKINFVRIKGFIVCQTFRVRFIG